MSTSIILGSEIQHNEKPHLVVRIVNSNSILEDVNGVVTSIEEHYAELRGPNNEVEFVTLVQNELPFTEKKSTIKALPTQPWRVKK